MTFSTQTWLARSPGEALGILPITATATALPDGMVIGQEVEAVDTANSQWGKFKLLFGVASLVAGNTVTYDPSTGLTTLTPNTAGLGQPIAVAMAANVTTTSVSWFQIQGVALIKKTAVKVNPNVALYQSGTTGRLMPTAASGKQALGTRSVNAATVASATSTVLAQINYPFLQGQAV